MPDVSDTGYSVYSLGCTRTERGRDVEDYVPVLLLPVALGLLQRIDGLGAVSALHVAAQDWPQHAWWPGDAAQWMAEFQRMENFVRQKRRLMKHKHGQKKHASTCSPYACCCTPRKHTV